MQRFIEDPLSEEMLLGRFHAGDAILADLDDEGNVIFRNKKDIPSKKKEKELVSK